MRRESRKEVISDGHQQASSWQHGGRCFSVETSSASSWLTSCHVFVIGGNRTIAAAALAQSLFLMIKITSVTVWPVQPTGYGQCPTLVRLAIIKCEGTEASFSFFLSFWKENTETERHKERKKERETERMEERTSGNADTEFNVSFRWSLCPIQLVKSHHSFSFITFMVDEFVLLSISIQ